LTFSRKQLHAGLVQLTRRDLQMIWEAEKTKKRTFRHFALGLALSPVMEMQALPDFARGTLGALNDIEALPESAGGSSGGLTGGAMATLGLGSSTMSGGGEKKGVVSRPSMTSFAAISEEPDRISMASDPQSVAKHLLEQAQDCKERHLLRFVYRWRCLLGFFGPGRFE
jgi:hypothetical protein